MWFETSEEHSSGMGCFIVWLCLFFFDKVFYCFFDILLFAQHCCVVSSHHFSVWVDLPMGPKRKPLGLAVFASSFSVTISFFGLALNFHRISTGFSILLGFSARKPLKTTVSSMFPFTKRFSGGFC